MITLTRLTSARKGSVVKESIREGDVLEDVCLETWGSNTLTVLQRSSQNMLQLHCTVLHSKGQHMMQALFCDVMRLFI